MNVSQYGRKTASRRAGRESWRPEHDSAPQARDKTRRTSRKDEDPEARKGGGEALGPPPIISSLFIISESL